MQHDKISAKYKSDIQKNEQQMNDLLSRKRRLEKKRQELFDWKRRDMAYYNQLRNELYGSGRKQDLKLIDTLMDTTQHACRRIEHGFEQEYQDLERQRKYLSAQKDDYQFNYRRDMQDKGKREGGAAT